MKFIALIAVSLFMLSACTGSIVPISGTPTADKILSNARRAAGDLDSYRATITTTVTTHYPQTSIREVTGSHVHRVEVGAPNRYRMLSQTRDFEFVSLQGDTYFKADGSAWSVARAEDEDPDRYPPVGKIVPPAHPNTWLEERRVVENRYVGLEVIDGIDVYLVEGKIPVLPMPITLEPRIPTDNVRLYIDTKSFQVIRAEIELNIQDSLREDVGYQVIPGVVEVETLEVYDFSDHSQKIEIPVPDTGPSAQSLNAQSAVRASG